MSQFARFFIEGQHMERLAGLLTLRQRRTCALAWGDRKSHAEIGAAQGISHWAIKKRVQRARRRLQGLAKARSEGRIDMKAASRSVRAWIGHRSPRGHEGVAALPVG